MPVEIRGVTFSGNKGEGEAADIYIWWCDLCIMDSLTFSGSSITSTSYGLNIFVWYQETNNNIEITNCVFNCRPEHDPDAITTQLTGSSADTASAVFAWLSNVTLSNNEFYNCWGAEKGGAMHMRSRVAITDTESTYVNSSALEGGAIFCSTNCVLTMTRSKIVNNRARNGAAAVFESTSTLTATELTISGNSALLDAGAF